MTLRVDANIRVTANSGSLATDIYRPADGDAVTVLVTRTMYGKSRHLSEGCGWVARGFGFVVQDVRGRYESDGRWEPYRNERADGAALLDWLRSQPWVGDIVLLGGSYNAYTAWAAAVARPDVPAGVVSMAPALGLHAVKFDDAGVLRLDEHVRWWVDHADGRVDRAGLAAAMATTDPSIIAHLPVIEIGQRLWADAPGWQTVIDDGPHPGADAIGDAELSSLEVHSLHVCGWYDVVAAETIRLWRALASRDTAGRRHTLVVGPWDHDLTLDGSPPAPQVFPAEPFDLGGTIVAWLHGFASADSAVEARTLPIGSKHWIRTDSWPPATDRMRIGCWHATPDGALNSHGAPPGCVELIDDPADPVPSVVAGWDRSQVETHPGVARFTSAPVGEPLVVAGTPSAVVWADSTSAQSDWIVRLAVVCSDGRIAELATGNHTASHRRLAGTVIDLSPCSAVVAAGNRLRLELAGTDFPRLARNLGTGPDRYRSSETRASTRTVFTGADAATSLSLPLVTEADL